MVVVIRSRATAVPVTPRQQILSIRELSPNSPSLGSYSRPLHRERVNLLRAGVAGEYRRAVRGNADFGISGRADPTRQALQPGDRLYHVIGQPNAERHWFHATGGVVHILVIR